MRRWKVYRRVLVTGELSRGAETMLTKQGVSRDLKEPGVYHWNWILEASTGEEVELLMASRLEKIFAPYGVTYACTRSFLTPVEPE
jgi:hypothetical protein